MGVLVSVARSVPFYFSRHVADFIESLGFKEGRKCTVFMGFGKKPWPRKCGEIAHPGKFRKLTFAKFWRAEGINLRVVCVSKQLFSKLTILVKHKISLNPWNDAAAPALRRFSSAFGAPGIKL